MPHNTPKWPNYATEKFLLSFMLNYIAHFAGNLLIDLKNDIYLSPIQ